MAAIIHTDVAERAAAAAKTYAASARRHAIIAVRAARAGDVTGADDKTFLAREAADIATRHAADAEKFAAINASQAQRWGLSDDPDALAATTGADALTVAAIKTAKTAAAWGAEARMQAAAAEAAAADARDRVTGTIR